jgi:hypothetical protein
MDIETWLADNLKALNEQLDRKFARLDARVWLDDIVISRRLACGAAP